jgi:hypothetical protein
MKNLATVLLTCPFFIVDVNARGYAFTPVTTNDALVQTGVSPAIGQSKKGSIGIKTNITHKAIADKKAVQDLLQEATAMHGCVCITVHGSENLHAETTLLLRQTCITTINYDCITC